MRYTMGVHLDLVVSAFATDPRRAVEAAQRAEAAGFDGVWTYDHLSGAVLGAPSVLDVWTTLGAMAQATQRVRLGPLVANVTNRHPAVTAVAAATLQQLSQGRAVLGLGAGAGDDTWGVEMRMIGQTPRPAAERRRMVEEAVDVVRGLWAGNADLDAEHFPLIGATGFLRPEPPPDVMLGANGPRMAALAGRVADAVNLHSWEDDLGMLVDVARTAAADAGRTRFDVTVEAPMADPWLDPSSPERRRLDQLGVARLLLSFLPTHELAAIDDAASRLGLG